MQEEDKKKNENVWQQKKSLGGAQLYLKPILGNILLLIEEEKKNTENKLKEIKKILNAQKGIK